jgi:two-component system LytT family response regulator
MITAIIADDEAHARERLRELLERCSAFDIVGEAADGSEALSMIVQHVPQVAFLDINMPGVSVFTALPTLRTPPLIVFQTAYAQHAARAFDIDAIDYLLKPLRFERLEQTVARIRERIARADTAAPPAARPAEPGAPHIPVTINGATRLVPIRDIVRISFENGFSQLYTVREKIPSEKYLSYFEHKLAGARFFRASRTDIINLDAVAVIHKMFGGVYTIELNNGARVDLSRRKAQRLKQIIDF